MPSASLFAAFGVAPNIVFGVLSLLYVLASLYVYTSLIHQISARKPGSLGANAPALRRRFEQAKHRRVLQWPAHARPANHDHRFRNSSRASNRRISISIFPLQCHQTLFWPPHWGHVQRAAVRRSARTFSFVRPVVGFRKLFRDCVRMERFHSCRDDDAFAFQFTHPYRPCISGDFFSMKVRDLGEDRLIEQLLPRLSLRKAVATAPGDDCAVVEAQHRRKLLVLKTDCVVERVHFLRGTNAFNVGWKAMMRPLSDFAATSAVPQFALITLMAPKQTEVAWVKELYRGLRRAAKRFEVSIVGGETSSTPGPVAISTSVVGFVERDRAVSRRGGKAGDDLFVTGRLGGGLKQKHLQFIPG